MACTRREFGKLAFSALPLAAAAGRATSVLAAYADPKPNSLINGGPGGTITYDYRRLPDQSAQALLGYIVADGVSAVELMGQPAEQFAGAPATGRGGPSPGSGRAGGRRGQAPTPEQQAAQREAREALRKWRTGV